MAEKEKKPIQILRDRHGGMSAELKDYFKDQNQIRKKITGALKGGAKTIPQMARDTGLDSDVIMWHVMALKRYGELVETALDGDFYQYALKEES